MTDNEIIKALECCCEAELKVDCKKLKCPFFDNEICNCMNVDDENAMYRYSLDLINRQQAEIERLQKVQVEYVKAYFDEFLERFKNDILLAQLDSGLLYQIIDELVETMKNEFSTLADFTDLIKSEAIKEFAERLKETANSRMYRKDVVYIVEIDNLAKEMVGEE